MAEKVFYFIISFLPFQNFFFPVLGILAEQSLVIN